MARPNKSRGEIPLPEAGKGFFLRFDVNALELLEQEFGEEYFDKVMKGLAEPRMVVFKACIDGALREPNGEISSDIYEAMPWGMSFQGLQDVILDGLFTSVYGRTFEEQRVHEEKLLKERNEKTLKEMEENPQMAAALFAQLSEGTATEPDSDPKKSVA